MAFADKVLTCRDCGAEFTFTGGEQEFYQTKGLMNEPGRCPSCRASRRRARSPRPERELFDITCDSCGMQAQVPFQPQSDRPVYCNECFTKMKEQR